MPEVMRSLDPRSLKATDHVGIFTTGAVYGCQSGCCRHHSLAKVTLLLYRVGDGKPAAIGLSQQPLKLAIERLEIAKTAIRNTAESLQQVVRWMTPASYLGGESHFSYAVRNSFDPELFTLVGRS